MKRTANWLAKYLEDLLVVLGCLCILYGLSLWSVIVTWIVGGLMLAGAGVVIGKVKAKHDHS